MAAKPWFSNLQQVIPPEAGEEDELRELRRAGEEAAKKRERAKSPKAKEKGKKEKKRKDPKSEEDKPKKKKKKRKRSESLERERGQKTTETLFENTGLDPDAYRRGLLK